MLRGHISYEGHVYNVKGVDYPNKMSLRLSSSKMDDIMFMAGEGAIEGYALWDRSFDITNSRANVETKMVDGKKEPVNNTMFLDLAWLIDTLKSNCNIKNAEGGFGGLADASGEFEAVKETSYIVPVGDTTCRVVLKYGVVTEIDAKVEDVEIYLKEDHTVDIFTSVKNGVSMGFKSTPKKKKSPEQEEFLGWADELLYANLDEVIQAHPDKELEWLRGKNYNIVTDDDMGEILEYIWNHEGFVYYDTETTGLKINFKSRTGDADVCVGIILSVKFGESYFFPMQMKRVKNLCGGNHKYFMERYVRRILEKKPIICHNASFDWKVAYIYNICTNVVGDTQILLQTTVANEFKSIPLSLKNATAYFLKRDSLELSDLVKSGEWGTEGVTFADLPEELVKYYACADTDNTQGINEYAKKNDLLTKYGARRIYEIEVAFALALGYQEFYGHLVNVDSLSELKKKISSELTQIYGDLKGMAGHDFNPNSSPQLKNILYTEMGVPVQYDRKTGKPTTNANALKFLGELTDVEGNTKYPFCKAMLDYRKVEAVRKTVDSFNGLMSQDGYIFSDVYQFGADTGRVSIHNTNYQSYNDTVKKEIVPRPGYYMCDTDYSSVEYRITGCRSHNKAIIESFYDPDFDYHTYQASRMYGVPYASVTSKLRKAAKSINFGLPYGMGDESLGLSIFGEASAENTRKAKALKELYFRGQEDIRMFFEDARNEGVNQGYTTTFFGRRRYYDKSKFSKGSIRRQAGNFVIQGCIQGDTRIQTLEYGVVFVKNVEGLHLHVWDGEDWTEGIVACSGKKRKCIVHFGGGQEFVCSPDHRFCVRSSKGNDRFVRCEDLLTREVSANAHRVVIQGEWEDSSCEYTSEDYRGKFDGTAPNSNNLYLEDFCCDSFGKGVLLGRLASDGNYSYKEDEHSRIRWVVAEHELDIMDELVGYLDGVDCSIETKPLRENRNEKLTYIDINSKSLTRELQQLDIRHRIPDEVFMDTEMLRGFIRGFFDGDGGISGKTIKLTQGSHYDFEPMFRDMQKALLFFGIRSRYHKYDDRYTLTVSTRDNRRFLDTIGFMSQGKQAKGYEISELVTKGEFNGARCLVVESVEITDEYIDMYDVCDTEKGFYIADGVLTHNCAADIYKLAVGRVFKRIVREGWLGKVLLPGFIHDELLIEVSNEINPMIFLRVLREEFELEIKDPDGTPWCPLYMGFGFGRSWYEAKKTEIPITMQKELVDKWGTSGIEGWNGDINPLCDSMDDRIHDFEIEDCKRRVQEESAQGKHIKPALYKTLLELVGIKDNENTQVVLDKFCEMYGVDRGNVDLLDLEEGDSIGGGNVDFADSGDSYEDDEDDGTKASLELLINERVTTLGMYVDVINKVVRLRMCPDVYMQYIKSKCVPVGSGGYAVMFRDSEKYYTTKVELPSKHIQDIQQMYLSMGG